MPPAEFEPAIPTGERPQTYALDRAATELGNKPDVYVKHSAFLVRRVTVSFCRDSSVKSVHVGNVSFLVAFSQHNM